MLSNEFLRFFQTLDTADVPADVRKMANLVWDNMDSIIPLGTAQGQRIRRIVELAQPAWDTLSLEVQPLPEQNSERVSTFSRLRRLSVGPFRGFARQEEFDLDSRLVLIYGPNGTGGSPVSAKHLNIHYWAALLRLKVNAFVIKPTILETHTSISFLRL